MLIPTLLARIGSPSTFVARFSGNCGRCRLADWPIRWPSFPAARVDLRDLAGNAALAGAMLLIVLGGMRLPADLGWQSRVHTGWREGAIEANLVADYRPDPAGLPRIRPIRHGERESIEVRDSARSF